MIIEPDVFAVLLGVGFITLVIVVGAMLARGTVRMLRGVGPFDDYKP